jgi:hypothetical protein
MLDIEQIDEWRGEDVIDRDGEKLGKLDEVYYDSTSGRPAFASVRHGLLGRKNHVVPLNGASVSRSHIRVAYPAETVHGVEVEEVDGTLDPDGIRRAAVVYGLAIDADGRFESSTLLAERSAVVEQARERADELEGQADRLAQEAEAARGRAAEASRDAQEAERRRLESRRAAEEARSQATHAEQQMPPGPDAA